MSSLYDVNIKSWDGKEKMLDQYRGKVSLVVNVTGDCGNAPQFEALQRVYDKYKDKGFEIIAVPTNQFCGSDPVLYPQSVTYADFAENGISCADDARDYAVGAYDVTYSFTELVNSKPGKTWFKQLKPGEVPHEIYEFLTAEAEKSGSPTGSFMFGNFEKYLVDKDGKFFKHYVNGTLLDYAKDSGSYDNIDNVEIGSAEEEFQRLCEDIEYLLNR